jgi:hypothetical protein
MFRVLTDYSEAEGGTYRVGEIMLVYADIERAFGKPLSGDEFKVSGEWIFKDDETGAVFTLYDWKCTNLYDPDAPSVEKFRANPSEQQFNIGGTRQFDVSEFKALLMKQIAYAKRNEAECEIALIGFSAPYIKKG